MNDVFPLDVASEEAFFDREKERSRLKKNILANTHTLITSPRRYGKTSLVLKTLSYLNTVSSNLDMMLASDEERMKMLILDGIGRAISLIASNKTKIIELIKKAFQPFNTIETIELGNLKVKFLSSSNKPAHLIVLEALQRLENITGQLNKKVVLFMDEYQHVLNTKHIQDFEASLRSFAQTAKNVVCIFSGSNRHLLQTVFGDQSRPFYNMCDHIMLERISQEDYFQHLSNLSKQQWKEKLPDHTINLIIELTACHPYYVNALCRRFWSLKKIVSDDVVLNEWQQLAKEKHYEINSDFECLTPIQKTILFELSRSPFAHPTSKEVTKRINASLSGIINAMTGLIERDFIYKGEDNCYKILNPLMEYILREKMQKIYLD